MKSWSIFYLIMIWVFNQIIYTISQYHSCVCVHVLWTSRWMKNWNGSLFPILHLTFYILLYLDFTTNYGYLILEPRVLSEIQIRPIIFIFCELQILHHRYWSISYQKKCLWLWSILKFQNKRCIYIYISIKSWFILVCRKTYENI